MTKKPNFWVYVSPGSALTLARGDGIPNHHLIAYSLSNISAKKLPKSVNVRWSYSVLHHCRFFETQCIKLKISQTWSSNSRADRAHLWTSGTTRPKNSYSVEYLRIYWTNFCNYFTIWKHFWCRGSICTLFSDLLRDDAMATK